MRLPKTLLVTGARAPVALHLVRLLAAAGHRVLIADSLHLPLARFSRLHEGYTRIPSLRFSREAAGAALAALIRREEVGMILPTCEEIFHLSALSEAGVLPCPLWAPPRKRLAEAHHKYEFIRRCQALGIRVPETRLLRRPADLAALAGRSRELVFKPAWSRFASQVLVRPEPEALSALQPGAEAPWIAQDYLPGEEISLWAMAHHGNLRGISAYRAIARAGQGAAVACDPVDSPEIRAFARRYIEGTGWHGQISFDLRRDELGRLLPIECNPRGTSGLQFFRDPAAFTAAFGPTGTPARPDVTRPQGVRSAMLTWGLPRLLREPRQLWQDLRRTGEMTAWPGDTPRLPGQLTAMSELCVIALRRGIPLQAASTYDMEWNGGD